MDLVDAKGAAKVLADEAATTLVPALAAALGPIVAQIAPSIGLELTGLTIKISAIEITIERKTAV